MALCQPRTRRTFAYGISGGAIGGSTIIDTVPYDVSKAGTYGTLYLNSATGEYLFMPNNIAINALSSTQSETYTVTATDNEGITGAATLTVIINGVNDTPTITAPTSINVIVWTVNVLTGISFADVDAGSDNVTVTLSVLGQPCGDKRRRNSRRNGICPDAYGHDCGY